MSTVCDEQAAVGVDVAELQPGPQQARPLPRDAVAAHLLGWDEQAVLVPDALVTVAPYRGATLAMGSLGDGESTTVRTGDDGNDACPRGLAAKDSGNRALSGSGCTPPTGWTS